jgi:hypothetical protein
VNSSQVSAQRHPVVLLGASNLTLGWKPMIQALQSRIRADLDVFVALGMGRSWVDWSRYFARRLPGISRCGLWQALEERHPSVHSAADYRSPRVLMTDIGNDLVYRRTPEVIAGAVEDCIVRLRNAYPECPVTITELPLSSLRSLTPFRFRAARSILFPGSDLKLCTVIDEAEDLNERIRSLAIRYGAVLVKPRPEWYGFDPIHIRSRHRLEAFGDLFGHWPSIETTDARISSQPDNPRLPISAARIVFGKPRRTHQPVFRAEQLVVSAY